MTTVDKTDGFTYLPCAVTIATTLAVQSECYHLRVDKKAGNRLF